MKNRNEIFRELCFWKRINSKFLSVLLELIFLFNFFFFLRLKNFCFFHNVLLNVRNEESACDDVSFLLYNWKANFTASCNSFTVSIINALFFSSSIFREKVAFFHFINFKKILLQLCFIWKIISLSLIKHKLCDVNRINDNKKKSLFRFNFFFIFLVK